MEWQPIETALKDGTEIIIFKQGWVNAPVGKWAEYGGNPVIGFDGEDCYMWGWEFDEFTCYGYEDGFLGWDEDIQENNMPTHWMPLPEPPEKTS